MRFPSLRAAAARAQVTARRFPLVLLSGAVAAAALIALIEGPDADWKPRVWATAILGMALFTAIAATAERRRLRPASRWVAGAILAGGLGLLAAWSLSWTDDQAVLRFLQLGAVAHLAVAVLPFARGPAGRGFWQFNRYLLLQYLLAGFYAVVLWVGLALALAAIDQLLGIDVREELYPQLMAVLAFVFHPWFMLAGLPDDLEGLDELEAYPIGLKAFAQFVLLPLVTVYLVILTIYLGKVLVTREWPSGWIGWLVSGVSVVGVLALLLLHPIRDRADSRWVNAYGRWFFLALLPSLGMLLVAIGKRIDQYGITEPRYYLLVLAVWLVALALYYVVTASRDIRAIPLTLGLVALVTAWGPWGAFATSRRSQLDRMDAILAANGMGRVGAPVAAAGPVSFDHRRELSAILDYLGRVHGPRAVGTAVGVPDDSLDRWAGDSTRRDPAALNASAVGRLGVEYVDRWARVGVGRFHLSVDQPTVVDIAGYTLLRRVALQAGSSLPVERLGLSLESGADVGVIRVLREGSHVASLDLTAALAGAGVDLDAGRLRRPEPLMIDAAADGLGLRLVLENVSGERRGDRIVPLSASGILLIRAP